ncbi:MAG: S9 family peptidase [bacterium]|nr:S9 family peptidase [bacterium]
MNGLHSTAPAVLALLALSTTSFATAQQTRYRDTVFANVDVQQDIQFGQAVNRYSGLNEALRLDLYRPRGDAASQRAAVVVVHGGGFVGGDKRAPQMVSLATDYAERGFVAISINYRLRPRGGQVQPQDVTDAGHDMKAAVRWLRRFATQLRIDPERIAGTGSSAGGFTCCEAAYIETEGVSGNPGFSSELGAIVELWGGLADLNQLEAGETPVQIIHGTDDPTVVYQLGVDLHAQALAVGVPTELLPIPGAGHGPWGTYFASFHDDAIAFVYEHLQLGELSGLVARPGASTPGTLTLDTFGVADDLWLLMVSLTPGNMPFLGIGTLCLDINELLVVTSGVMPSSPRLPSATWSLSVPAGMAGLTIYWQAIYAEPSQLRLLTNCLTTSF